MKWLKSKDKEVRKLKNKILSGLPTAILVVSFIVASCAAPTLTPAVTPTPTLKPSPATTPKPAATSALSKPIRLRFTYDGPTTGGVGKQCEWYLSEVENRTGKRVQFERYFGGVLAKTPEALAAVGAGIADVGLISAAHSPGPLPLGSVVTLPATYRNVWEATMALHDVYKEVPALREEMAKSNARFLSPIGLSAYCIASVRRIDSLATLKGKKIMVTGTRAILVDALGAVPVGITMSEVYTALERGTIDGTCNAPSSIVDFGLYQVVKYYWPISFGGALFLVGINLNAWNKLPADIQRIMEEVALEQPKADHRIFQIEADGAALEVMKKAGVAILEPSLEAQARVTEVAEQRVWNKWVADTEKKGLPARQVLDKFIGLVKKYEPINPFK
jgi:TRAP-type C4-dicarboxylate transport system substrate-binding protein